MLISMPRQLLTHSTLFGETSAALQHASVNSATKLRWDLTGMCLISVGQHCQMQTPQESNLYSRAWNVSPARTTEYRRTTSATTMLHLPGLQSTDVQPVSTMLHKLQWDSLQQRRARSHVLMLYRIRSGLVAIPAWIYLQPVTVVHARGFETSYRQIQCNTSM